MTALTWVALGIAWLSAVYCLTNTVRTWRRRPRVTEQCITDMDDDDLFRLACSLHATFQAVHGELAVRVHAREGIDELDEMRRDT